MSNIFDLRALAGQIATAKDKATGLAPAFINDGFSDRVIPPVPFPFGSVPDHVRGTNTGFDAAEIIEQGHGDPASFTIFGTPMCFPLFLKPTHSKGDYWLLPTEPIITLGGGNETVRRHVAKARDNRERRGTIKERWSTDDDTISIEGLFTRHDNWEYPRADVERLMSIVRSRDTIDVKCILFEIAGISKIVIDKFDLPFTKGPENQAYRITAWSDDDWDLLIKI